MNVRLYGKILLIQKQGEITSQEVEKSIKDLPLPEKVKAIAIYKRYNEIKKIEKEMEKAVRDIEKKYLKSFLIKKSIKLSWSEKNV